MRYGRNGLGERVEGPSGGLPIAANRSAAGTKWYAPLIARVKSARASYRPCSRGAKSRAAEFMQ